MDKRNRVPAFLHLPGSARPGIFDNQGSDPIVELEGITFRGDAAMLGWNLNNAGDHEVFVSVGLKQRIDADIELLGQNGRVETGAPFSIRPLETARGLGARAGV